MRRTLAFLIAMLLAAVSAACGQPVRTEVEKTDNLTVVTTIFPLYDWAKAILGEGSEAEVSFLLDTGVDLHSFQPTAKDLMEIGGCDLFLYIGGESDSWVEKALRSVPRTGRVALDMLSCLGNRLQMEKKVEGMEGERKGETEPDEHVWLSLKNTALLVDRITETICRLDEERAETYRVNAAVYIEKLEALDRAYEAAVTAADTRTLVFGDRFPFQYMAEDYGLNYYAAFPGCSAEAEASFETVLFLAGKLDELDLNTIVILESSDSRLAQAILDNSARKERRIVIMDSMQSITSADVLKDAAYISIMENNLAALEEVLR